MGRTITKKTNYDMSNQDMYRELMRQRSSSTDGRQGGGGNSGITEGMKPGLKGKPITVGRSDNLDSAAKQGTWADSDRMDKDVFGGAMSMGAARLLQIAIDVASMIDPEPASRLALTGASTGLGAYLDSAEDMPLTDILLNGATNVGSYLLPNMKLEKISKYLPYVLNFIQKSAIVEQFPAAVHFATTAFDALRQNDKTFMEYMKDNTTPEDLAALIGFAAGITGQTKNYKANKKADAAMASNDKVRAQYVDATDNNTGKRIRVRIDGEDYRSMVGKSLDEQNAYINSKFSNDVKLRTGVSGVVAGSRVEAGQTSSTLDKAFNTVRPSGKYGVKNEQGKLNADMEFEEPGIARREKKTGPSAQSSSARIADSKVESHNKKVAAENDDAIALTEKPRTNLAQSKSGDTVEVNTIQGDLYYKDPATGRWKPFHQGNGYVFDDDGMYISRGQKTAKGDLSYKETKRTVKEKDASGNEVDVEKTFMEPEITIDGRKIKLPDNLSEEQQKSMINLLQNYFSVTFRRGGAIRRGEVGLQLSDDEIRQIGEYNKYIIKHPWYVKQGEAGQKEEAGTDNRTGRAAGTHGYYIRKMYNSEDFKPYKGVFDKYIMKGSGEEALNKFLKEYPTFGRGESGVTEDMNDIDQSKYIGALPTISIEGKEISSIDRLAGDGKGYTNKNIYKRNPDTDNTDTQYVSPGTPTPSDAQSSTPGTSTTASVSGQVDDAAKRKTPDGSDVDDILRKLDTYGGGGNSYEDAKDAFYGTPGGYHIWDITRPIPSALGANVLNYRNAGMAKRYAVPTYKTNDSLKTVRLNGDLNAVNSAYKTLDAVRNGMSNYTSVDMDKNMNAAYGITDKGVSNIINAYGKDRDAFQKSEMAGLAAVDSNRNSAIKTGDSNLAIANNEIQRRNLIDYNTRAKSDYNMYEAVEQTKDRYAKTRNYMNTVYGPYAIESLMSGWNAEKTKAENAALSDVAKTIKGNNETMDDNQAMMVATRLIADYKAGKYDNINDKDSYFISPNVKIQGSGLRAMIDSFDKKMSQYANPKEAQMRYMKNMTSRFAGAWDVTPLTYGYKHQTK